MKIPVPSGVDAKGNILITFAHPYLVGKRRDDVRIPTTITDPKTGKTREGFILVDKRWMKLPLVKTQAKEMKRYANR